MTHVITGASGLLGSRLLFDLYQKKEPITVLVRSKKSIHNLKYHLGFYSDNPQEIINQINISIGDMDDYDFLSAVITADSFVYHCAAKVSFNPSDKEMLMQTNAGLTEKLVLVCLDKCVKKFCYVSSVAALGSTIEGVAIDEKTPRSGSKKSGYSVSKYQGEMEVWKGVAEGLRAVIVNPAVILGPGNWNKSSAAMIKTVAKGMQFYTRGITGYVDVRDVSAAMIALMRSKILGERFLLSVANISYQDLFTQLAEHLRVKRPKYYANRLLTGLTWRLLWVVSRVTGKTSNFTKQTHQSAHKKTFYDGSKITKTIDFAYTPIAETLNFVVEKYQKSHAKL